VADISVERTRPDGRRILVVATGGTIQTTATGIVPFEAVRDRLSRYDDARSFELPAFDVRQALSAGADTFTPEDWLTIRAAVMNGLAGPYDGIVVTHGTFTTEETAYFLHLTLPTSKPVVVTCSQRKHGTTGNDGDRNLVDALRVASSATAAGRGVVVLVNEEIHSAREVTKVNQRPGGFDSGRYGLLGSVESDGPMFYRSPERRHTGASEFARLDAASLPEVDIVATYAGAGGRIIRAAVDTGTRGIVVNGFAYSGRPHPNQVPELIRAMDEGIPVVVVNRGNGGRVPIGVTDPFIAGDNLTAQKARILLALCLTRTNDPASIQALFATH
jgi:L-asparaginase